MKLLTTNRLIIRKWKPSDLADFNQYASVVGVGEMAGWEHHKSLADSQTILQKLIQAPDDYCLQLKQSGKVIGSISLQNQQEIGLVIAKDYWHMGFGYEALKAMIDYAFNIRKYDAIYCGCFLDNLPSQRLILKCGFTPTDIYLFQNRQTQRCVLLSKNVYFSETLNSPIGKLIICATPYGVAAIGLETDLKHVNLPNSHTQTAKQWLNQYFSNIKPDVSVVFDYQVSPFQQQVYQYLAQVEYGQLTTYKALARKISPTMSSQAVGTAVGNNPILILLGCHRVIKSNGQMGNYGPGKTIKRQLLKLEGSYHETWDSE